MGIHNLIANVIFYVSSLFLYIFLFLPPSFPLLLSPYHISYLTRVAFHIVDQPYLLRQHFYWVCVCCKNYSLVRSKRGGDGEKKDPKTKMGEGGEEGKRRRGRKGDEIESITCRHQFLPSFCTNQYPLAFGEFLNGEADRVSRQLQLTGTSNFYRSISCNLNSPLSPLPSLPLLLFYLIAPKHLRVRDSVCSEQDTEGSFESS